VFGNLRLAVCAVLSLLVVVGCARLPERANVPVEQRPSPNYNERRPNYVILHHTSDDTAAEALRTLTDPFRMVSAHYLVARDGSIYLLVDELARAWHAGESYWAGDTDMNSASIGIELDNNGDEPFPDAQIRSLLALLADIKERYGIPTANFLGHGDVAPGRKVDPSRLFPWKRLAEHGFGLWCEPPYPEPPRGADVGLLLSALGYDVSNLPAAISSFKRHFEPDDTSQETEQKDRALLYCLILKKQER